MKARIKRLNALFIDGMIDNTTYAAEAAKLLRPLDWQRRLQFENMLFTTI